MHGASNAKAGSSMLCGRIKPLPIGKLPSNSRLIKAKYPWPNGLLAYSQPHSQGDSKKGHISMLKQVVIGGISALTIAGASLALTTPVFAQDNRNHWVQDNHNHDSGGGGNWQQDHRNHDSGGGGNWQQDDHHHDAGGNWGGGGDMDHHHHDRDNRGRFGGFGLGLGLGLGLGNLYQGQSCNYWYDQYRYNLAIHHRRAANYDLAQYNYCVGAY